MSIDRRAAVISIGDELVLGQSLDTNARWLSDALLACGVRVHEHVTVPDDHVAIARTIERTMKWASIVIVTGGLGPTEDDMTRPALAEVLGEALVEDEAAAARLTRIFAARDPGVRTRNLVQALRPASARCIPNERGTAPGLDCTAHVDGRDVTIFALPGPPSEMTPMFDAHVRPGLAATGPVIRTRRVHTMGLGESDVAARLGDVMRRDRNPLVGTTASGGAVTCRIRFEGDASIATAALDDAERIVREVVGPYVIGVDGEDVERATLAALVDSGGRLVTVESCTGGLLGSRITAIPGSSAAYEGGWQTYSNEMKAALVGVPADMLATHGAVSAPVARAMARGGLERIPNSRRAPGAHALAITGIAGPGGGSPEKPVGTVWIARASRQDGALTDDVRRFVFRADRDGVRERSARFALLMLLLHLRGEAAAPLLWEQERA
ncbi:MAG: CinA family nicotinamide mononucleotide deamidase-related protein [Phycisphaerales bacterium]